MLTFRPFLIAHVNHQKSTSHEGGSGTETFATTESLPWLEEACGYAVDAARNLIRFLAKTIEQKLAARVGS